MLVVLCKLVKITVGTYPKQPNPTQIFHQHFCLILFGVGIEPVILTVHPALETTVIPIRFDSLKVIRNTLGAAEAWRLIIVGIILMSTKDFSIT